MNFLAFPHCTAAESHKSFFLFGALRQSPFEPAWVIHVLGYGWYQHWRQVFLITKVLCCNEQLILRSHELAEICFSDFLIWYQSELLVVICLENFDFDIHLIGINIRPWKLSKCVLAFTKVHIADKTELVQGSSSDVRHEWTRQNSVSWKYFIILVNERWRVILELPFGTYILFFFGYCHVTFRETLFLKFVTWNFFFWFSCAKNSNTLFFKLICWEKGSTTRCKL